jgi:undecaprenyl-diphosphatase
MISGFTAALGALLTFAWLSEEVFQGNVQQFDEPIRLWIHQYASPTPTSLMRFVTMLGSTAFLLAWGVSLGFVFLWAGWRRSAILLAVTMAGASMLDWALKMAFHRARPAPFFDTLVPSSYSYPSGHALLSFCFYSVLAAILAGHIERRVGRILIRMLAVLLITLIGVSRIYLGVHYPSDVLAGYLAALVWILGIVYATNRWRGRGFLGE